MLSRNSASSRAIPPEKLIDQIRQDPFVPEFNHRVKGMGVGEALQDQRGAASVWLQAKDEAVRAAERLLALDVDKSRINRLLEPFMWHTVLVTATEWSNFFGLRTHEDTQPEFRHLAGLMQDVYNANPPWYCPAGKWHMPLVSVDELGAEPNYGYWKPIGTGRCARISYLTHTGQRDHVADVGLHNRLLHRRHMSPFEHLAQPFGADEWDTVRDEQDALRNLYADRHPRQVEVWCRQLEYCGNLRGWKSYRSEIPDEHDFSLVSVA